MTRDDLSEFLTQEENGWDLDNLIHEVYGKIQATIVPPMFRVKEIGSDNWLYNLLIGLIANADEILAVYHFAQQKEDILQVALGKTQP